MGIKMPRVVFGTSGLGNLFTVLPDEVKLAIVSESIRLSEGAAVFDTAGKYGAGLALEVLGRSLRQLGVAPDRVVISNKLGWLRSPLLTEEPTFEPGVWKGLAYDAVQRIGYEGILECFEQGNALLGGYSAQMVSVHDPDEYISAAGDDPAAKAARYNDILDAYEALFYLKRQGKVSSVGVGAKDWRIIQRIVGDVQLDWVMFANSMTLKTHPRELTDLIRSLAARGVYVINSAVFHSGFLVGSDHFDYRKLERGDPASEALFLWRERFFETCRVFGVRPAAACVQFALRVPGVSSIALQSSDPARVAQNIGLAEGVLPTAFWEALREKGLIEEKMYFLQ